METYTYDAALRLVSVSDGASTTTYAYNGDGDRVSQAVDGVTTTYLLDITTPLTMVLAEQTGTDPAITYLHGLDLVAQSDGTTTEYFAYDGLGSVRQLTDPAGDVLLTQTFDPYGSLYARAGESVTSFGFTGEYGDTNGLLYLRARYYAPSQGRFFQLDPSRMEMNPYLYGAENPILFVDPSGNICLDPFAPTGIHFRAEDCGYPAPHLATRMTEQVARTLEDVSLLLTDCGAQDAFWAGYSDQLFTDLSLGLWTDTYERWFGSQYAYWIGRRSGCIASNLLTGIEFYVGSTTALAASAAVPPTLLGGAACTAASGGTCVIPVIVAVGAEGVVVVAGTAVAVHGLAVAGNNMFNPISGIGGTGSGQNRVLNIDDQQFGKKVGKHARDYGLDPSDRTSREWIRQHIEDVFYNADEIREGSWRGLGPDGSLGDARFYIQGNDVVVTDVNNNLVTILRDGIHNARVIGGRTVWP